MENKIQLAPNVQAYLTWQIEKGAMNSYYLNQ